ncbi:Uncharacterised protein g10658 [Pycnogonum litorale]
MIAIKVTIVALMMFCVVRSFEPKCRKFSVELCSGNKKVAFCRRTTNEFDNSLANVKARCKFNSKGRVVNCSIHRKRAHCKYEMLKKCKCEIPNLPRKWVSFLNLL